MIIYQTRVCVCVCKQAGSNPITFVRSFIHSIYSSYSLLYRIDMLDQLRLSLSLSLSQSHYDQHSGGGIFGDQTNKRTKQRKKIAMNHWMYIYNIKGRKKKSFTFVWLVGWLVNVIIIFVFNNFFSQKNSSTHTHTMTI